MLGWSGGARPISGRGTVDPEVWTWQLIRESRWRFAGLMEHSPTLLVALYFEPFRVDLSAEAS